MTHLVTGIDEKTAIKIARRFLEQHHSVIISHTSFQGDCWVVTSSVGFLPEQVKKVRIDIKSGKIIECF